MATKPTQQTVSLRDWFLLNLKVGALTFGGGDRMIFYQNTAVDKKNWISEDEFQEVLSIAQLVPGPNLVNLSLYLGLRLSGIRATLLGLLALAIPGSLVILLIHALVDLTNPHVGWLFKGFSIASATLFLVFILRFSKGLFKSLEVNKKLPRRKIAFRFLIALTVAFASFSHVPLHEILIVSIGISFLSEWLS